MKRTLVLIVLLAILVQPGFAYTQAIPSQASVDAAAAAMGAADELASSASGASSMLTQENPEVPAGGMPGWPVPDKPVPHHEPGHPSRAGSYTTQVLRENEVAVQEVVEISGLDAMAADGLGPLAGNHTMVNWDKLLFSAYQNLDSFGLQTLGYSPTLQIMLDTYVSLGNYQSNDIAAGDLNGDGQAEQIAAWIGPGNHLYLRTGEMPGTQRATSTPAAVPRSDGLLGGYALHFDGADDYVNAGSDLDLANASFTVAFWARRDTATTNDFVVGQGTHTSNGGLQIGFRDNNKFTCAFFGNDLDTPAYTDTGWHYWACTYNSDTNLRTIYRDGVQVAQDTSPADYQGAGELYIGRHFDGLRFFGGLIDGVGIWNAARTQEQIQADRNRLAPDAADLVAYWPFDEGSGTTTADASGNGHTGTLVNGPEWDEETAPRAELHLLVRGYDEALWHCLYDVNSGDCLTWSNAAGGILASAPAIVYRGPDQFDVFALGVDNLVYQRHWDATGWSADWVQEPPDPALQLFASSMPTRTVPAPRWPAPAVVARGGDQLDLFRLAPDNTLRWRHSDDGTTWGAWQNLGGMLASGPGVVSWGPDHMQVFARGVDETLWTRTYDGAWGAWARVPLNGMDEGVTIASAPAPISPADGEIVVYVRGSDDQLWSVSFAGGSWGTWGAGGDPLASGVGAALWGGDRHVFSLSDDGRLQHSNDEGHTWTQVRRLEAQVTYDTGSEAAAPAPASDYENFDVDVETGRFLGDGRDQIVVAYRDKDDPNRYHIKVYDVRSGFKPTRLSEAELDLGAARIATGDFDGDGLDEIAVVHVWDDHWWMLHVYDAYNEQGNWSPTLRMVEETDVYDGGKPFAGTLNIVSGDFDGDGLDEIAVSHDWCEKDRPTGYLEWQYNYRAAFYVFDDLKQQLTEGYRDFKDFTATSTWDQPIERSGFALAAGNVRREAENESVRDEIVRHWPDRFAADDWPSLVRQLEVWDAEDLTLSEKLAHLDVGSFTWESWAERLAVGDLDRDLVEEIAFFKVVGGGEPEGNLQVHVFEYVPPPPGPTEEGSLELMDSTPPDPISFDWLRSPNLATGDFTGESLRVGAPTYRLQNRVDSLVAVINMPPKHRDYIKIDDGGGNYHYELFEILTEPCIPTAGDPRCTHAAHATSTFEESSTKSTSQRDWAIGAGLDGKVAYSGIFVDTSLKYSYGDHFGESHGDIQSSSFTQAASATTQDSIVYFGTPYKVWEYPVIITGTQEPAYYITVIFPVPKDVGGEKVTRAADITTGGYPAEPWYRAGHQTYNAWSYDPLGAPGFPDFDPDQVIMSSDCAGGGCGYSFATDGSTVLITDTTKTHDFSAEVGGGFEAEDKVGGTWGVKVRAHVKGSYKKADIETEVQTTTEETDISAYIDNQPMDAQFTTRLIGYWAADRYLVLDYQTDMPIYGLWNDYYSSPDPAFILPWSGFPYGDDPVGPTAGLELFSPELQVVPQSASVGETVTISATVRNFSNVPVSNVKVRFCRGDPGLTCEPPGGEAYIGEVLIPQLNRQGGPVTVTTQWEASGIGKQRIYAVIDPDNTIDPEVHDEDDLINNNVAYGFIKIGAAVIVDQGLASEQAYQRLSYDQEDSWMVSAYVPPENLSEVVYFELQDASLNVPNAIGKPFELVAYEGNEFREEPNYDFSLRPDDAHPPAVISLAQYYVNVANLKLYRAMDNEGSQWIEATCPGYQIQRFPDEDLILVPVCLAGIFVFAETPPGPTPAPAAQFSAATVTGPVPLAVAFTDQSSNFPTSWAWDFGDGWTSTEQHLSHIYTVPGTYTVTLSASNPGGSDTESKPNYVTATGLLAAFSADPVVGLAPLTVTFTDQSAGIPGLTSWAWDFGDSGTSTEQHPEHTYTTTGTFTVTLTVANGEGSDTLSIPGYITVKEEQRIYLPLVLKNAP